MSESRVHELRAAIEARAAVDTSNWTAAERSADLLDLFESQRQLDALIARLRSEADGTGTA